MIQVKRMDDTGLQRGERSPLKIQVTRAALACFVEEWGIRKGDAVRIYARYGAGASPEGAYSLGIERNIPKDPSIRLLTHDILFYVESADVWFLDGRGLTIDYLPDSDEIDIRLSPA